MKTMQCFSSTLDYEISVVFLRFLSLSIANANLMLRSGCLFIYFLIRILNDDTAANSYTFSVRQNSLNATCHM